MKQFVQLETDMGEKMGINPEYVSAVLPGANYNWACVVLSGGLRVQVKGTASEVMEKLTGNSQE